MTSEDYLNRLISGWWGEKAQEYAERVAKDAFGSPGFLSLIHIYINVNYLRTAIRLRGWRIGTSFICI